jgi:branched-chain amino acid transport system permease protein
VTASPTIIFPAPRVPIWMVNLFLIILLVAAWPSGKFIDANLDDYYLDLLIRIGINIMLAVSLNLINGITGQFSLGHAGFMALGAYTAGVLMKHSPPTGYAAGPALLGVTILGGLIASLAGLIIGIPTLRLRGDYLAIATLGFGQIIIVVINKTEFIGPFEVGGASGLHDIPKLTNFFWVFTWTLACIVVNWRLVHSAKGKAFLAVRDDEIAAAAMGVDTTFHKVAAFVIGAFFAGAAGGLAAMWSQNLAPASFNFLRSIEIVVMAVVGGSGSITGAIIAATFLTYLPEQLRVLDQWRMVIYSLLLILMMILRPEGLLGRREIWFTRRRRRPITNPPIP